MTEPAATTIALPAIADLDALETIRDELVAAGDGGIRVDAHQVERVGTNTLLLLLAAAKAAESASVPFHIADPSPVFRLAVMRLGITDFFSPLIEA